MSWVWIALSIFGCVYVAMRLVRAGAHGIALAFVIVGTFGYTARSEDALWGPILSMAAATVIGLMAILWKASPEDR